MQTALLIAYSLLLGWSMKWADLCNEHSRLYFRFDNHVLGIVWGLVGAVIVFGFRNVGTLYASLVLSYIFRGKVDFWNHCIGASSVLGAYVFCIHRDPAWVNLSLFVTYFFVALTLGTLHDKCGGVISKWISEQDLTDADHADLVSEGVHTVIGYVVIPFFYSYLYCDEGILYSFAGFALAYETTRHVLQDSGRDRTDHET